MHIGHLSKTGQKSLARMLLISYSICLAANMVNLQANADNLISVPFKPEMMSTPPKAEIQFLTPAVANEETADVLLEMGKAALSEGRFKDAASLLAKAASDADMDPGQRDRITGVFQDAADALFEKGTRFPDNVALDLSIELSTRLLSLIDKIDHPSSLAAAQNSLGKAMAVKGARFGDHPMLNKGMATIRTALLWRTYERSPTEWAQSQIDLAEALVASARISETNENFDEAIKVCQTVISKKRSQLLDAARAKAHSVMANGLWQYGQRERDATLILSAKNAAQQALDATDREALPLEWATTLNYLANANREYSYWTSDAELLTISIRQYNQSLEVRTREKYPLQWAQTQLDLGNALRRLTDPEMKPNGAELSVQAYEHSLEVRTEVDTPLEWGMSQNNLAAALSDLLELKQARVADDYAPILAAYQNAIKATTRERSPLDWALMQANLGSELVDKWNAKQRTLPKDFQNEMDAAMRSQEIYPLRIHHEMHQLAMAKITQRQASVSYLEEATAAYDNALLVYSKTEHPWKWINTIHNKANVHLQIGVKQQNPRRFEDALKIFREEQTILQRQYDPRSWASLESAAGIALYNIGTFTWNSDRLREAETAYLQAIEAYPKGYEAERDDINENLAYTQCFMGGMDASKAKIQEGVDRYQALKVSSYAPKRMTRKDLPQRIEYINQRISQCYGMIDTLAEANSKL